MNHHHSSPNHDFNVEQQLEQRTILLDSIAQEMRTANASEDAILTAISGFTQYLQATSNTTLTLGPTSPTHFLPLSDAQIARYSSIPNPQPIPDPPLIPGQHYSDLPTTPLHWLFAHCLPFGHLTLLEGPSGSGTTLIALSLASRISKPKPTPHGHPYKPAVTILIAPYHSPTSVTKPRLHALGADPQHILNLSSVQSLNPNTHTIATRPFSLPQDLTLLEDTITHSGATFVIIDPTSAILPASAPRTVLPHLAQIAQRTHCAILLIRPIKAPPANRPLPTRSTCSPELLAAFASALLALPDPEDPEQCLLISTKHSLTQAPNTLLYHITTAEGTQPTITWIGEREPIPDLSPKGEQYSQEHKAIIGILRTHTTTLDIPSLSRYTGQTPAAFRQMLHRMLTAGELVSPARGLYTTPGHPSLVHFPPIAHEPSIPTATLPVTNVTNHQPTIPVPPTNPTATIPVTNITNHQPTIPVPPTNPTATSPVTNVTTNQSVIPVPPINSTVPSIQTAYGHDESRPVHLTTNQPATFPVTNVTNQPLDQEHTHP